MTLVRLVKINFFIKLEVVELHFLQLVDQTKVIYIHKYEFQASLFLNRDFTVIFIFFYYILNFSFHMTHPYTMKLKLMSEHTYFMTHSLILHINSWETPSWNTSKHTMLFIILIFNKIFEILEKANYSNKNEENN